MPFQDEDLKQQRHKRKKKTKNINVEKKLILIILNTHSVDVLNGVYRRLLLCRGAVIDDRRRYTRCPCRSKSFEKMK